MKEEFTEEGAPIFIDTSGELNRKEWNNLYAEIKYLKEKRIRDQEFLGHLVDRVNVLYDFLHSWKTMVSQSGVEDEVE